MHARLVRGGMAAARERSWGRALTQLAEGYDLALAMAEGGSPGIPAPPPRLAGSVA